MIQIDNLAFSYGSTEVLRNITMNLEPGKIYGLLGENGVGKTTLLTLLCGLKKTQAGTITTDGHNPWKREPVLLQDQYYLPDEVAPVNDKALAWGKATGKFWPKFSAANFEAILREFEVEPDQKMNAMSAGQLKKTYIAFALAAGVRFLFLDEPTNGLDIPSKAQFRSALMKYTAEDATIVISTHQVRDLENIIDPIIILDRQDVLLNASLEQIADKLYFDYGVTLHPDSLYSEQLPGGFIQVLPNTEKRDSKVNIEALFNTVHKHKELVKSLFNHE
ncbi:MAG: ATP-binding cassette domain-containing protein [Bacteroidales bacterium]|nr:ATP-binding cassette domain-containing protein [Bacteroidales bacterium]